MDATTVPPAPPAGRHWFDRARNRSGAIVLLVTVAVASRLPGLVSGGVFNVDESTVATMSMTMRSGGHLYQDVVDRKPPLVPALYGVVQWLTNSTDLRPVRVVGLLATAATGLLLASEAKRRYHLRASVWMLALVPVLMFVALPPEDGQAIGFEVLALLPATAGFILSARGRVRTGAALTAVAALCKQTFALGLLPVLFHAYRWRRWKGVVMATGVFVAVIVAIGASFGWHGFFYWSFQEAFGYTGLDASSLPEVLRLAGAMGLLLGLSFSGPLVLAWGGRHVADKDVLLWLATGLVAYVVGFRFLGHYAIQVLPPAALLALRGFGAAPGGRRRVGLALTAASAAVWVGLAIIPDQLHGTQQYKHAADYVRDTTTPTDRVFVWGQTSELYWASDRLPATRFPHIQFLTALTPGRLDQPDYADASKEWTDLWQDFNEHPPTLILDSTLDDKGDARFAHIGTSPIATYLDDNYRPVAEIDDVMIYRRTTPLPPEVDPARAPNP